MATAKQTKIDKRAAAVIRRTLKAALKDPVVQTDPRCVKLCEVALEVMDSGEPNQWATALLEKFNWKKTGAASTTVRSARMRCASPTCTSDCFNGPLGRSNYCRDHQPSILMKLK